MLIKMYYLKNLLILYYYHMNPNKFLFPICATDCFFFEVIKWPKIGVLYLFVICMSYQVCTKLLISFVVFFSCWTFIGWPAAVEKFERCNRKTIRIPWVWEENSTSKCNPKYIIFILRDFMVLDKEVLSICK